MTKKQNKKKAVASKTSRVTRQNRGIRNERLPSDGLTFTALTSMPKTLTPSPLTYTLCQSYISLSPFTTSVSVNTFLSYTVSLSGVDQSPSLVAVFDQYRILEAELWLMPRGSVAANTGYGGVLSTVIDLDDSTNLATLNTAGDYASCVTTESNVGHYRHWTPHAAISAYNGAFGAYANVPHPWCDTSSPTITHYGVKIAASITTTALVYDINVRLKLQFRSVR